jgi:ABC-type nitrate/sulfonate/bicarbonate transport system ATPase subunit
VEPVFVFDALVPALVGPSGNGKKSILSMIAGWDEHTLSQQFPAWPLSVAMV